MPAGRLKIKIDWNEFEKLCGMQCTLIEIAGWFNCSEDTIERAVKSKYNKNFADVFRLKRGKGLISLRRYQWKLAEKNPSMAIFLGKNFLGQSDRHEVEHSGGVTIIHDDIK